MEPLRRPLLSDCSTLTTIVEAEVERSTAVKQPSSLPTETGSSDSPGGGGRGSGAGDRKRSTWGGRESRQKFSQRKPKRATDLVRRKPEVDYPQPLRAYNIHEEGYGLEPAALPRRGSEVSSTPSTRTSSFSEGVPEDNEFAEEEEEGVIDGVSIDGRYDFVDVRLDTTLGEEGMSTTKELTRCKKTVLVFYLNFLKVIGWRRWRGARQDLDTPLCTNVLNIIYPSFIFLLMCAACVTQTLTCFYRDEILYRPVKNTSLRVVKCVDHIFTRSVVADALLLVAYLLSIYLFRYGEPEHLSALMERVYLSFNFKHRISPQTRLTFTLRMILSFAAVWVLVSLAGNIVRLFSLRLLSDNTYLSFISNPPINVTQLSSSVNRSMKDEIIRYSLVIYSIAGFILFDMLYVAVVLSYVSHAQLLLTYINSVIDKVQTKAYALGKAIRDMSQIYDSLKVLNGTLSHLTSLCLFIFISTSISSLVELGGITRDTSGSYRMHIAVGVINFAQWTLLALAPLIQASRLTSNCRKLRRLGLEIGARPFSYHDTPQLVLDSFLQYTNATRYTAKLAGMPVYPAGVIGFFFVFGIIATWALVKFDPFAFAKWF